jgi:inorganic pyrophosphatase
VAVPTDDVTGLYRNVNELEDVDELLRMQIRHFFEHYKDLETGKWVKIHGWKGAEAARREVLDSVERYNALPVKPENW